MNLYELAFTSHVYNAFTNYNADYLRLLERTGPELNLERAEHRQELIDWLNQWGCRQFALGYHSLASEEMLAWHRSNFQELVPGHKPLWDLTDSELFHVSEVFDSLVVRTASHKVRNGQEITTTFGPTGASKILFALRPHAMIAWDTPIRNKGKFLGNGGSYKNYLYRALEEIESLKRSCLKHDIELEEIPGLLERDNATVAQLVGEYFWVTITRECLPPTIETAAAWARWST